MPSSPSIRAAGIGVAPSSIPTTSRRCSPSARARAAPSVATAWPPSSPHCRLYLGEVARRRINLDSEIRKLDRLVLRYGEADVADAMGRALAARTFGARYVRALVDQSRFARGLGEPPEPIVTGNACADAVDVTPHDLETYDALFQPPKDPEASLPPAVAPREPGADCGSDPTDR